MHHIILLYYKYTFIDQPNQFMREHKALCNRLHLKGRVLISRDGVNGTVSGTKEATDEYMATVKTFPGFEDVEFKIGASDQPAFPKMSIKVRAEIITLKAAEPIDIKNAAPYIEADEMYQVLKEMPEDTVIIDARNEYESRIGKFKNALTFAIENFRDIPEKVLPELEKYKDKKIITYCTGGVRCEPFSALLRQKGYDVRQLHGGIIKYAEKHSEFGFDGHCYVFDNRVSVKVNDNIFSTCEFCDTKTARYINCKNNACHRQLVCCEHCDHMNKGYCLDESMLNKLKKFFTNFLRSHESSTSR
ncbi:MAG: rhodanese-related sulfurtransferase [Candidatus Abawacabacteria bacterium]|nr:rhodanese-related sulfurtransferase [Candidatus Abawacabacteria bacterium]